MFKQINITRDSAKKSLPIKELRQQNDGRRAFSSRLLKWSTAMRLSPYTLSNYL